MKAHRFGKKLLILASLAALAAELPAEQLSMAGPDKPGSTQKAAILGGDEGDACKMLLCLSDPAGSGLPECKPPLDRYFSMEPEDRAGFLAQCPMVE